METKAAEYPQSTAATCLKLPSGFTPVIYRHVFPAAAG